MLKLIFRHWQYIYVSTFSVIHVHAHTLANKHTHIYTQVHSHKKKTTKESKEIRGKCSRRLVISLPSFLSLSDCLFIYLPDLKTRVMTDDPSNNPQWRQVVSQLVSTVAWTKKGDVFRRKQTMHVQRKDDKKEKNLQTALKQRENESTAY